MRRWLHNRSTLVISASLIVAIPAFWAQADWWQPTGYLAEKLRQHTDIDYFWRARPTAQLGLYYHYRKLPDGTISADDKGPHAEWVYDWPATPGESEAAGYQRNTHSAFGITGPTVVADREVRRVYQFMIGTGGPITEAEMVALAQTATPGFSMWHDGLVRDGVVTIDRSTNWRINPFGLACDLIWLFAIAGAIDSWLHRKQWPSVRTDHTRCGACGYSREGLTINTCPECGDTLPQQ